MQSMHPSEFLHAVRTFIARRTSEIAVTDNAPQFIIIKNVMCEIWEILTKNGDIQNYFSEKKITWKLIPQHAPWMGGAYERLIQITKNALKRTYFKITFSDRQLITIAAEIEAIVNSRPLTYIDKEPDALILTPNHFLQVRLPAIKLKEE